MRAHSEHVGARLFLEDARRSAVIEHGERLELLGDRRDREAAAGRDIADHRVDLVTLHKVAKFGDDIGCGTGFVNIFCFDLAAAEADLVEGCRHLSGVHGLDHDLGAVASGDAERGSGGSGQEADDAKLHGRSGRGSVLRPCGFDRDAER
jgi:hypothetical protein